MRASAALTAVGQPHVPAAFAAGGSAEPARAAPPAVARVPALWLSGARRVPARPHVHGPAGGERSCRRGAWFLLRSPARSGRSAHRGSREPDPKPAPDGRWKLFTRYLLSTTFHEPLREPCRSPYVHLLLRDRRRGGADPLEIRSGNAAVIRSALSCLTRDLGESGCRLGDLLLLSCWLQERGRRPDGSPSHEAAISLVA